MESPLASNMSFLPDAACPDSSPSVNKQPVNFGRALLEWGVSHLAQIDCSAIPQLAREHAKLIAAIAVGRRFHPVEQSVSRKDLHKVRPLSLSTNHKRHSSRANALNSTLVTWQNTFFLSVVQHSSNVLYAEERLPVAETKQDGWMIEQVG